MNSLINLGWSSFFQNSVSENDLAIFKLARVTEEQRSEYQIISANGQFRAVISGKLRFRVENHCDFPTVGDWVLVRGIPENKTISDDTIIIEKVLPRKSLLTRKLVDGHTPDKMTADSQPIAANIDTVFIMSSLNRDFNPRRLERYISIVINSKAVPVLIFSKADLCKEIQGYISMLYNYVNDIDMHVISAVTGQGLENISPYLKEGKTSVIIGSSGVGKSTLINSLMEFEEINVKRIREDDRGRHTTTVKSMYFLNSGGIIIDTPGLRGLQIADDSGNGTSKVFSDIEELIQKCRFKNCTHKNEPGCAVREALENKELEEERYINYIKLEKEISFFEERKKMREYLKKKKNAKRALAEKNRKLRNNCEW